MSEIMLYFATETKNKQVMMQGIITSVAQELAINNILRSEKFGNFPYTIKDEGNGYVSLHVELPQGTISWAYNRNGRHDAYYWGKNGFEKWHRLFYGQ